MFKALRIVLVLVLVLVLDVKGEPRHGEWAIRRKGERANGRSEARGALAAKLRLMIARSLPDEALGNVTNDDQR
ncbi:MAG: hypothetical protein JOZ08_00830 [Verrucomicrobia bacterium]|nr:hypothetical protein [Verrucomicrobiota bacterium]MBV8276509.1 hypothetical protein [Verrucomicrobiota bacterium]